VDQALAAGASRVSLGTAAVEDPTLVEAIVRRHGTDRVAVAADVRDGRAIGRGWRDGAPGIEPEELLRRVAVTGVTTFEVTAIERDGLAGGPDLALLGGLVDLGLGRIIASGGVRTASDLRAIADLGCAGAIVGRALYDGTLSIEAAIEASAPQR
jgi:phosphoribosylformimino-5-aminoimidazole carboxamide ribotide isomerase